jgi:hypothetical protein
MVVSLKVGYCPDTHLERHIKTMKNISIASNPAKI